MIYNKLVRDKIIEIIEAKGETARYHIADETEYKAKLLEKLAEEVMEFSKEPSADELADILEVVEAIYRTYGFEPKEVEIIKQEKSAKRGAFTRRIILEES